MTLPFQDQSNGKRRWQCFVCGREFKSFDEFREHIVETHEEGREFIVCDHCQAPVRDLKMHYAVQHKGWGMPAGSQHKATIWRDQLSGKKKPAVRFRSGSFMSTKNREELHYRSGMESEVYELLESDPNVIAFDAEKVKIPYLHDGQWRTYIPDLSILFSDGTKALWEVKPKSQTSLPINESKWMAAQQFCDAKGLKFMVLTETGLNRLKVQVRQLTNHEPI